MKTLETSHPSIAHNTTAHDAVAGIYDAKHVEIFNALEQGRLTRIVAELVALTGLPSPDVLDMGAGTGNVSLKFAALGCKVSAADVSVQSLERLARKAPAGAPISTHRIDGERLPFPDGSFDIVTSYSVLHHIPDYLLAVREMARVLRPGGYLYIDHEASEDSWNDDPTLREYREKTRLRLPEHLWSLIANGEAFTFSFAKTVFMKAFVDRRYQREGDLHVWHDDRIEWTRIGAVLAESGVETVRSESYLHYVPRGGEALFERFRDRCNDTQLLIARKKTEAR
jgi:ubiquinone/menaquinone biosynthesis C-methylase UbiE